MGDKDLESESEYSKKTKELAFEEIRIRFNKWCFNMYSCAIGYIIFFLVFKTFLIDQKLRESEFEKWLGSGNKLAVLLITIFLGTCFILDSVVASYLKSPLQRLNIKIEASPIEEKSKNELMRSTQEANELFKETLKKFGILVIPIIFIDIANGKIGKGEPKVSDSLLFNACYLIPILYASYRIWKVNWHLKKIKMNERRK